MHPAQIQNWYEMCERGSEGQTQEDAPNFDPKSIACVATARCAVPQSEGISDLGEQLPGMLLEVSPSAEHDWVELTIASLAAPVSMYALTASCNKMEVE